jgi:magnesium transporter
MTTNTPPPTYDEPSESPELSAEDAMVGAASAQVAQAEAHTLVAKGPDVPLAAEGALKVEGTASVGEKDDGTIETGRVHTLLFAPDASPSEAPLSDVPTLAQVDRNFVWVELVGYTEADLRHVADVLRLPPAAVETTLGAWKRPRMQVFGDRLYVTATTPLLDPRAYRVEARELDLFLSPNLLVSAQKQPLPFGERILARASENPTLLNEDAIYLLYIFLDELVGYYEQIHEQLVNDIERMEERALRDTSDEFLHDLVRFKRYAFTLSQLADQHRPIFDAFLRPDFRWVDGQEVEAYYRDLDDRLGRLSDLLHGDKDAINGAFDIYVSHMSHRTNHIMKILTIVSTVLLPTSVILGFFGTNNIQDIPALTQFGGFVVMVATILVISAAILLTFHRKGWL